MVDAIVLKYLHRNQLAILIYELYNATPRFVNLPVIGGLQGQQFVVNPDRAV